MSEEIRDDEQGKASAPDARWRPNPDVVTQMVEGETVLVHLQTNEIYALNATGTRAWDLLAAGKNRDEVQESLQGEFDVPAEQLRNEIDILIARLVEQRTGGTLAADQIEPTRDGLHASGNVTLTFPGGVITAGEVVIGNDGTIRVLGNSQVTLSPNR